MLEYLLLSKLLCAGPTLINESKFEWNDFDLQQVQVAVKRCGEIYPNSPCLKTFTKKGKQDYTAICTSPKK